jgi:hypothetical protein
VETGFRVLRCASSRCSAELELRTAAIPCCKLKRKHTCMRPESTHHGPKSTQGSSRVLEGYSSTHFYSRVLTSTQGQCKVFQHRTQCTQADRACAAEASHSAAIAWTTGSAETLSRPLLPVRARVLVRVREGARACTCACVHVRVRGGARAWRCARVCATACVLAYVCVRVQKCVRALSCTWRACTVGSCA